MSLLCTASQHLIGLIHFARAFGALELAILSRPPPYLEVEELSQKLDGGLRTILLHDGHVDIVHEDHNLRSVMARRATKVRSAQRTASEKGTDLYDDVCASVRMPSGQCGGGVCLRFFYYFSLASLGELFFSFFLLFGRK